MMEVKIIVKYGNRIIQKHPHPCIINMVNLCQRDFVCVDSIVKLILQTRNTRLSQSLYGIINFYDKTDSAKIIIYTHSKWTRSQINTVAHEFGHLYARKLIPGSNLWSSDRDEMFATGYAMQKMAIMG